MNALALALVFAQFTDPAGGTAPPPMPNTLKVWVAANGPYIGRMHDFTLTFDGVDKWTGTHPNGSTMTLRKTGGNLPGYWKDPVTKKPVPFYSFEVTIGASKAPADWLGYAPAFYYTVNKQFYIAQKP